MNKRKRVPGWLVLEVESTRGRKTGIPVALGDDHCATIYAHIRKWHPGYWLWALRVLCKWGND